MFDLYIPVLFLLLKILVLLTNQLWPKRHSELSRQIMAI